MKLGIFERNAMIEDLAKKFCALQGYNFSADKMMQESEHPRARLYVAMAVVAIEEFESR